jgi:DNA-binding NarL/FixJ family response regulator
MDRKYKAVVIDDHAGVRDFIVEALRARNFNVRGYEHAEGALAAIFEGVSLPEQPDLVVVDLQLEQNRMQGIDLVAELADRNVASEILVISGNLGNAEMAESIMVGAGAALPKPFEDFRVAIRKMETLAETGKRRRLFRMTGQSSDMDSQRLARPVFLSYSSKDKRMANGLRRNLESRNISVWYAPYAIEGGEVWEKRIQEGITQATIFVALVTANYLESAPCFGELFGFQGRLDPAKKPDLLVLPLLFVSQKDVSNNPNFGPILRDFQSIDASTRFIDGLTLLLARIQDWLPEDTAELDNRGPSHITPGGVQSFSGKIA